MDFNSMLNGMLSENGSTLGKPSRPGCGSNLGAWIILLIIICCCCNNKGGFGNFGGCGSGNCGCGNSCGCGNCGCGNCGCGNRGCGNNCGCGNCGCPDYCKCKCKCKHHKKYYDCCNCCGCCGCPCCGCGNLCGCGGGNNCGGGYGSGCGCGIAYIIVIIAIICLCGNKRYDGCDRCCDDSKVVNVDNDCLGSND